MNDLIRRIVAAGALLATAGLALAGADEHSRLKEPRVPAELASKGVIYHTISGKQAQVTFTSNAPLENIVGKSNLIVGYAVAGPADAPARLVGAQWLLPVRSLATGLPLRDEHMADEEWLDAESFPVIRFTLKKVEEVKPIKSGEGYSTWSATFVGEMSMHGVDRPIRVTDAKLSFLEASDKTAQIAGGDLLFLKCAYEVRMSEFGIRHKDVPDKVSDLIRLEQMLRLSTEVQGQDRRRQG
jgi:polyisoprenoid-binding protein YceI